MTERDELSRRKFMFEAGRAAAGAALGAAIIAETACAASAAKPKVASRPSQAPSTSPRLETEKIRLGFIGVGGRGRNLLQRFLEIQDAEVRIICDVNQLQILEARKMAGVDIDATDDYAQVINHPEVDAVVIATPDHWHAILTVAACKAGKDVYVEKPASLCIVEGRRMVDAARKHGRIVQLGTQQLSGPHYQQARELIRQGHLGKVTMVRTWNFRTVYPGRSNAPDLTVPPATINWDRWVGPRPYVNYNDYKAHGGFRNFWDYAGGILTDWGVHHFHSLLDIMGYDAPLSVSAAGGKYVLNDITDTPDTLSVNYQFRDWTLEFSHRDTNGHTPYGSEYGIEFYGTDATMFLDRKGFMLWTEKDRNNPQIIGQPAVDNFLPENLDHNHTRDFIKCIRTRETPASEIEFGHYATTLAHLGNIAVRTGTQLKWNATTETFENNPQATALLGRTYRKGYELPEA